MGRSVKMLSYALAGAHPFRVFHWGCSAIREVRQLGRSAPIFSNAVNGIQFRIDLITFRRAMHDVFS